LDKHAVESVLIRIGSVIAEVSDERILSTWISHDDFVRLIECCAQAVMSAARSSGVRQQQPQLLATRCQAQDQLGAADSSDNQAERVRGKVTDNPVVERYQGGKFIRRRLYSLPTFRRAPCSRTNELLFVGCWLRPTIISAAFSAIMMTAALVFEETIRGITELSQTRRPCRPRTRRSGATTLSEPSPIRQVPNGW